jgi:hypothetical protein
MGEWLPLPVCPPCAECEYFIRPARYNRAAQGQLSPALAACHVPSFGMGDGATVTQGGYPISYKRRHQAFHRASVFFFYIQKRFKGGELFGYGNLRSPQKEKTDLP